MLLLPLNSYENLKIVNCVHSVLKIVKLCLLILQRDVT